MAFSLKIIQDTILKQLLLDSSEIEDPNLKYSLEAGRILSLQTWEEVDNHVKVMLSGDPLNGFSDWYAFVGHVQILEDGKPYEPKVQEANSQREDGFKLPGFYSTFYLSNPIIPDGHFYWYEAIHNGVRIPQKKSHVENIIALAKRLEDVRSRLGGFPLTITSWYRPEPWNTWAGGVPDSRHKPGQAVDILRSGLSGREMAAKLQDWSGGMGIYPQYPNLLHLDIRPYRARWGGA